MFDRALSMTSVDVTSAQMLAFILLHFIIKPFCFDLNVSHLIQDTYHWLRRKDRLLMRPYPAKLSTPSIKF